jgi:hypothetical protein
MERDIDESRALIRAKLAAGALPADTPRQLGRARAGA